jgi:predicted NAD-dependent protein-ADP-ribosyltransferase YbiA (DUF1768 family)
MRVQFKPGLIVFLPESPEDQENLDNFGEVSRDHIFRMGHKIGASSVLHDLGLADEALSKPINITLDAAPEWLPISNLAFTPFVFDGRYFASVEGFWQGLKFDDEKTRQRIALLHGTEAKHAGDGTGKRSHILWHGKEIAVGTADHWDLMRAACQAKFTINDEARAALLATGERPLVHRPRRDSRTIPGVIMAEIWMQIRASLT